MNIIGYRNDLLATARSTGPIVVPWKKGGEKLEYQAFHPIWSRERNPIIIIWSKEVRDRHYVTGRLQANAQTVTFCLNFICDEVSNLLSRDLLLNACSLGNRIRYTTKASTLTSWIHVAAFARTDRIQKQYWYSSGFHRYGPQQCANRKRRPSGRRFSIAQLATNHRILQFTTIKYFQNQI